MKKVSAWFLFILAFSSFAAAPLPASPGKQSRTLADLYRTGRVKIAPEVTIDPSALPEEARLLILTDLTVDPSGNIYLLDMQACNIKKFDRKGKFIRSLGRKGQGPGEFELPSIMAVSGDRLAVYDLISRKLSALDLDGNFKNSIPWPKVSGKPRKIMALAGGDFVLETEKVYFEPPDKPQDRKLIILGHDLELKKEIYARPVLRNKYMRDPDGERTNVLQPFCSDIHWSVSPRGTIIIGFSDRYELEIQDPAKGRIDGISRAWKPVAISSEDEREWFSSLTYSQSDKNGRQGIVKTGDVPDFIVKATVFPAFKPVFSQVFSDAEGNFLVRPFSDDKSALVYDAFDPDGKFISQVEFYGFVQDSKEVAKQAYDGSFWSWDTRPDGNWLITRWHMAE